ncbi:MAG: TIGR01212 family radical SAM protein [Lachnospiraceae bacterium]|nr:TIGR01212 family radical SAM protein [Lachnospiraceae bacterium]
MEQNDWHGKPYYSLDAYLKNTYGKKMYKIAIDAGFTCPNRDGTLGVEGCIFCSAGGSGDHAVKKTEYPSVTKQITAGISMFDGKAVSNISSEFMRDAQEMLRSESDNTSPNSGVRRFIAYFQAYTNTYSSVPHLQSLYTEALMAPSVAGISIATRPDCISEDIVAMLIHIMDEYPDKFVWIELGLQTIHDKTADFIRRGYPLSVYDQCVAMLRQAHIPIITHVILGLPHEIKEHMLSTIKYLNQNGTWGVKLQLLHVLKGTGLASLYEQNAYRPLSQEDYIDIVIDSLEHLSPDIVVHRLTGDGPRNILLAPLWSLNKRNVLNTLHHTMKLRSARQGRLIERLYP